MLGFWHQHQPGSQAHTVAAAVTLGSTRLSIRVPSFSKDLIILNLSSGGIIAGQGTTR
jgi:hypothetical protein